MGVTLAALPGCAADFGFSGILLGTDDSFKAYITPEERHRTLGRCGALRRQLAAHLSKLRRVTAAASQELAPFLAGPGGPLGGCPGF
jgi:hypothetical protein